MTFNGTLQLLLYMVVLIALAKPLGGYMARVYVGQPLVLERVLGPLERLIYRLCGVRVGRQERAQTPCADTVAPADMDWKTYALAMLLFNLLGMLVVYAVQRLQGLLPLNPQSLGAVTPDLSFNTATSFATNTNWQGYGGEVTMSYLAQMLALTVQNFVSAASGMATLVAFIRGLARHSGQSLGNFWEDLTRTTLYILLPLALVLALVQISQGVIQNFSGYQTVPLLQATSYEEPTLDASGKPLKDADDKPVTETVMVQEGLRPAPTQSRQQVLPMGPAASQVAIKQLGTNGGGFFNVNSAHPFENPTPLTNFVEMLAILLIPAALCYTFGQMVGDTRQGWAVLAAMTVIFVALLALCVWAEQQGNPRLAALGVDTTASDLQPGGNMEPTFKGSECPDRFFVLRVLYTTRSQDRVRHRPAGDGGRHQRAA
jgi:potassium-transporting ATPase potassium-binding subunit